MDSLRVNPDAYEGGFTLVELIMVMVVLSVLAVSTIGLFAGRESFSGRLLRDQLVSQLRLAQQVALARHDSTATLTDWTLSEAGSAYRIRVSQGGYTSARELDKAGATIGWTQTTTNTCASATNSLPLTLSFDQAGDVAVQTLICVTADGQNWPVCVTAGGYAHAGICTP